MTPAKKGSTTSAKNAVKSPAKKTAKKSTAKKATARSRTRAESATATATRPAERSAEEIAEIRTALTERLTELQKEYDQTVAEMGEAQRERLADSAGDDQVDSGSKTVEREQEISLANGLRNRVIQVEHALERLEDGDYGICERCGTAIPAARLAAFPSATLCVNCKQLEERR